MLYYYCMHPCDLPITYPTHSHPLPGSVSSSHALLLMHPCDLLITHTSHRHPLPWSVSQSVSQSVSKSVSQSVSQSASQSVSQSAETHPLDLLLTHHLDLLITTLYNLQTDKDQPTHLLTYSLTFSYPTFFLSQVCCLWCSSALTLTLTNPNLHQLTPSYPSSLPLPFSLPLTCLPTGLLFVVFFGLDMLVWSYGSTGAVPFLR